MTMAVTYAQIIKKLKAYNNPRNIAGMARYGINVKNAFGVPMPDVRRLARELRPNHNLAGRLWGSGIHDARHLAALIDDPSEVSEEQMERWARDFDSWDVVDGTCNNLFRLTPYAHVKAAEWAHREEEYVRRAGFVLMACLAVHDRTAKESIFSRHLRFTKKGALDERNFVKKAVNWALRQIGKRNMNLHRKAIQTAVEIHKLNSSSARWIASGALRELRSLNTQARIRARMERP